MARSLRSGSLSAARSRRLRSPRAGKPCGDSPLRFAVERLEDRTLLAFNLTLSANATVNVSSSISSGTDTFTAVGTGANLNWFDAYNALNAGNSVLISSGSTGTEAGNIMDLTSGQLSGLTSPNLKLTIQSGSGTGLVGNITLVDVNLSGPSSSIVLNAHGSIATGLISGGTFASPAPLASATLIAQAGTVSPFNSPIPGPLEATNLAVQANGGIGSFQSPQPIQAANLSALTATGGIFLSNTGNVNISGGLIPGVNGVQVATSGDIQLTSSGSITIATNGDIVKSPGNVIVSASGTGSDIQTGGNNNGTFGTGAIQAGLTATVSAGRDVLIGTSTNFGDVDGATISLTAGRDLIANNASFIDAHNGGTLTATTGRNITLSTSTNRISTQSGAISLTTGLGGRFTSLGSVTSTLLGPGAPITISADDVALGNTLNAGTASGDVVIIQPATTTSRNIDLGSGLTQNALDVSDAELGFIAASMVRIGRQDNNGSLFLTAPVTSHAGFTSLALQSGAGIIDDNSTVPDIVVTTLAMYSPNGIGSSFGALSTQVTNLSAFSLTGGMYISNTGNLNITSGPFGSGLVTISTDIQLSNAGTITTPSGIESGDNLTINATGAASDVQFNGGTDSAAAAQTLTIFAGEDILIGTTTSPGTINCLTAAFNAGRDVVVNAASSLSANQITVNAGRNIGVLATDGAINGAFSIALNTGSGGVFTNLGAVKAPGGAGVITISADDLSLQGTINAGTATAFFTPIVTLQQATTGPRNIDLGAGTTAGDLGISNTELDFVEAGVLRIGRADNAGSIVLTAPITVHKGFHTLSLITAGAISDNNRKEPDITVTSLALRAATGISADTAVSNLAFRNTSTGNVRIANTGALSVTAVDTLDGSSGNQLGNFAAGASVTLTSTASIAFNISSSSAGTYIVKSSGAVSGAAGATPTSAVPRPKQP